MNVKFVIDYDLIELVDAIGLDYDIINEKDGKEIEIILDEVEYFVDNEEELNAMNDSDLCDFLLNSELSEALIKTERIYD